MLTRPSMARDRHRHLDYRIRNSILFHEATSAHNRNTKVQVVEAQLDAIARSRNNQIGCLPIFRTTRPCDSHYLFCTCSAHIPCAEGCTTGNVGLYMGLLAGKCATGGEIKLTGATRNAIDPYEGNLSERQSELPCHSALIVIRRFPKSW